MMPKGRERYRQPPSSPADVDDIQRLPAGFRHPDGDDVAQYVPDQG